MTPFGRSSAGLVRAVAAECCTSRFEALAATKIAVFSLLLTSMDLSGASAEWSVTGCGTQRTWGQNTRSPPVESLDYRDSASS